MEFWKIWIFAKSELWTWYITTTVKVWLKSFQNHWYQRQGKFTGAK